MPELVAVRALRQPSDPIVQIDPRPFAAVVAQDEAAVARDTAVLANAQADLARYVRVGTGLLSEQQLQTQRSQVAQLKTGTPRVQRFHSCRTASRSIQAWLAFHPAASSAIAVIAWSASSLNPYGPPRLALHDARAGSRC